MRNAVTAELRKLRASRSTIVTTLVVVAFAALLALANVVLAGKQTNPPLDAHALDHIVRAPGQIVGFALLVLGVLAAAGEYSHHSILPTLLAQPRRARVVVAKVIAIASTGVAIGLAGVVTALAVGLPMLATHDAPAQHYGPAAVGVLTLVVGPATYGVLGVGLGLLLRNQAAAISVALIWSFVAERILPVVTHQQGLLKWLPGGAADAFARLGEKAGSHLLLPWQGGLLFGGYALAIALVARLVTVPRDVT